MLTSVSNKNRVLNSYFRVLRIEAFRSSNICDFICFLGSLDLKFELEHVSTKARVGDGGGLGIAGGVDSQAPCYDINYSEVDVDETILSGVEAYGEVYLDKWRSIEVSAKTLDPP
ncbi:hypothetical protein Dsin_026137 [Dipteronia sinensis]|uniref:Uncharacterized protein n=1 Tax=Dipteronia sinensis TaxID=43782 RepID=A0AAD9ZX32_9ROSI|nr:hypothetical protein Dsin_026137 [Dipteronia sinensis]